MINEILRLPEGGAWMGAFYVLPCKDAATHYMQAASIMDAEKAGKDCDISYTNALYCGVYPCFIAEAADIDATCISIVWPDESFELMQQAGSLINRALLAYHRGLTSLRQVSLVSDYVKVHIEGKLHEPQWEVFRPLMPILDWEPAKGGADALAALQPLFPPAPLGEYKINSLTPWLYEQ